MLGRMTSLFRQSRPAAGKGEPRSCHAAPPLSRHPTTDLFPVRRGRRSLSPDCPTRWCRAEKRQCRFRGAVARSCGMRFSYAYEANGSEVVAWNNLSHRKYRRDGPLYANLTMDDERTVFEPHISPPSTCAAIRCRCPADSADNIGGWSKR